MSDRGVSRTALATLGLLITYFIFREWLEKETKEAVTDADDTDDEKSCLPTVLGHQPEEESPVEDGGDAARLHHSVRGAKRKVPIPEPQMAIPDSKVIRPISLPCLVSPADL